MMKNISNNLKFSIHFFKAHWNYNISTNFLGGKWGIKLRCCKNPQSWAVLTDGPMIGNIISNTFQQIEDNVFNVPDANKTDIILKKTM